LSTSLREVLKESLKQLVNASSGVVTDFYDDFASLTMFIKKWWIKSASQEDLHLLNELIRLIKRYGHPNLVSENLSKFPNSPKFDDSDEIMVIAKIDLLIEAGVLSILEKGGLKYWYLFGEEPDPFVPGYSFLFVHVLSYPGTSTSPIQILVSVWVHGWLSSPRHGAPI